MHCTRHHAVVAVWHGAVRRCMLSTLTGAGAACRPVPDTAARIAGHHAPPGCVRKDSGKTPGKGHRGSPLLHRAGRTTGSAARYRSSVRRVPRSVAQKHHPCPLGARHQRHCCTQRMAHGRVCSCPCVLDRQPIMERAGEDGGAAGWGSSKVRWEECCKPVERLPIFERACTQQGPLCRHSVSLTHSNTG
jgi:hypothetical protein